MATHSPISSTVITRQRATSIRSVSSNASHASGVSLARRSRTRTRARTLTSPPAGIISHEAVEEPRVSSELPYLDKPLEENQVEDLPHPDAPPLPSLASGVNNAHPRPPRSQRPPEIVREVTNREVADIPVASPSPLLDAPIVQEPSVRRYPTSFRIFYNVFSVYRRPSCHSKTRNDNGL